MMYDSLDEYMQYVDWADCHNQILLPFKNGDVDWIALPKWLFVWPFCCWIMTF